MWTIIGSQLERTERGPTDLRCHQRGRLRTRIRAHFIPLHPLPASCWRRSAGHRVLDVATGTGLAAEAALAIVGSAGHVTATDISAQMAERARERLNGAPNTTVRVEDGQALDLPDDSFDAVICSLGLMFFPDPARGLAEFRRVLRPGGRAAASVNTVPERSYSTRIQSIIARYVPSLAPDASRLFSLGDEQKLGALLADAGFQGMTIIPQGIALSCHPSTTTSITSNKAGV